MHLYVNNTLQLCIFINCGLLLCNQPLLDVLHIGAPTCFWVDEDVGADSPLGQVCKTATTGSGWKTITRMQLYRFKANLYCIKIRWLISSSKICRGHRVTLEWFERRGELSWKWVSPHRIWKYYTKYLKIHGRLLDLHIHPTVFFLVCSWADLKVQCVRV